MNPYYIANSSLLEIAETIIHELIHAELMERCIQSGLIEGLAINSSTGLVIMKFNGNPNVYSTSQSIFNQMVL
jgi:hypothetical protein